MPFSFAIEGKKFSFVENSQALKKVHTQIYEKQTGNNFSISESLSPVFDVIVNKIKNILSGNQIVFQICLMCNGTPYFIKFPGSLGDKDVTFDFIVRIF